MLPCSTISSVSYDVARPFGAWLRCNRLRLLFRKCLGAVYVPLLATCLLPYGSLSGFLYHRSFFQGENAAGLYPCSAYYAATVTLETFFNTLYGAIFGLIAYVMINYQAFVKADDPIMSALGFIGIVVVMTLVANVRN